MPTELKESRLRSVGAIDTAQRAYTGVIELPDCRVLSLNGSPHRVGTRTEQPSGAFVTVNLDGAWIYEPPAAVAQLKTGQRAIDGFCCDVDADGHVRTEKISVSLRNRDETTPSRIEVHRQFDPMEDFASTPVRMLIKAATCSEAIIDLRLISGHESDETPAVLILEQAAHGAARVDGDSGEIVFRPDDEFKGTTELRCLTENRNRSATFVIVQIDVQFAD